MFIICRLLCSVRSSSSICCFLRSLLFSSVFCCFHHRLPRSFFVQFKFTHHIKVIVEEGKPLPPHSSFIFLLPPTHDLSLPPNSCSCCWWLMLNDVVWCVEEEENCWKLKCVFCFSLFDDGRIVFARGSPHPSHPIPSRRRVTLPVASQHPANTSRRKTSSMNANVNVAAAVGRLFSSRRRSCFEQEKEEMDEKLVFPTIFPITTTKNTVSVTFSALCHSFIHSCFPYTAYNIFLYIIIIMDKYGKCMMGRNVARI